MHLYKFYLFLQKNCRVKRNSLFTATKYKMIKNLDQIFCETQTSSSGMLGLDLFFEPAQRRTDTRARSPKSQWSCLDSCCSASEYRVYTFLARSCQQKNKLYHYQMSLHCGPILSLHLAYFIFFRLKDLLPFFTKIYHIHVLILKTIINIHLHQQQCLIYSL